MAHRRRRRRSSIGLPWLSSKKRSSPRQDAGFLKPQLILSLSDHFPTKKSKRRVSFNPSVVAIAPKTTKDDCRELWYSRRDIHDFRKETRDSVAYWTSLGTTAWAEDHVGVYQAVAACGDDASAHILINCAVGELAQATFDVQALGLEKTANPNIIQDIFRRRQEMYTQVGTVQYKNRTSGGGNHTEQVQRIRDASRTASRPCILYAHCVAKMAAAVAVS